MSEFIVVDQQEILATGGEDTVLQEQERVIEIVAVAEQGPPGPQGEPGPAGGSTLQRQAGVTLSALRGVYELAGAVFPLDYRDDDNVFQLLGVTTTAAPSGQPVNVQRSGVMDDNSWNWAIGRVYLGAGGALTQTPLADGFSILIGSAVSPTRLVLNIQDPIEME